MAPNYIEVRVAAAVDSGELLDMLSGTGALGAWEDGGAIYLYWPEQSWSSETFEKLRAAVHTLDEGFDEDRITVQRVPDKDWNASWAHSLRPIRIGRVLVRQSWNPVPVPPDVIELVIDPRRAFGTGYHATTQLVMEWLEERIRGGERVLDVGTGSGILAMVALRLGAGSAMGIDNDPVAIACAWEYAALNGFGSGLELRVALLEDLEALGADIIVANLDRQTLLELSGEWRRHLCRGGRLLISGLQREDERDIMESLIAAGASLSDRRERDEWLALELQFSEGLPSVPGKERLC